MVYTSKNGVAPFSFYIDFAAFPFPGPELEEKMKKP